MGILRGVYLSRDLSRLDPMRLFRDPGNEMWEGRIAGGFAISFWEFDLITSNWA